ncbi:MAG: Verru_Chthon cassette protein D [Prosthecobacter sp.]
MKHISLFHPSRQRGFTLVEIVVVLAIVTVVLAFGTPYAFSTMQASSLTSVGDTVMQKISMAQQRAVTENRVTALQFYFYEKDGITACHAMQLVAVDPATNAVTALEGPAYWSDGRVVLLDGELSPIFTNIPPADTGEAPEEPFRSLGATFHRVRFYPGGGTSLEVPLRQAYLTLVNSNKFKQGMTEPPPNYYTVQIDPVAGRSRSYRP